MAQRNAQDAEHVLMNERREALECSQTKKTDAHVGDQVRKDDIRRTAEDLVRSLDLLDVNKQTSVDAVDLPPRTPQIVSSLMEYHANIGCYQCYLFLDSHKSGEKHTQTFDVKRLSVRVKFPRAELTYRGIGDQERMQIVWWTEVERNVDVTQCTVEDKEDHWYVRLPIRPSDKQPLGGFSSFTQVSPVELQTASYASVCCRGCSAQLLGGDGGVKIDKVLPLPSANWMDMFDFWGAGIGAFEHIPRDDIHAQRHRVLVGESYVLVHASDLVAEATVTDCKDEASIAPGDNAKEDREWVLLKCASCFESVGLRSVEQPETVRLHKHLLIAHQLVDAAVKDRGESHKEKENVFGNYTIDSILCAKLLEIADSDGVFRFALTPSSDNYNYERSSGRPSSFEDASSTELQLQLLSWETMIKQHDTNKFRRVLKVLYGPRQPMSMIPGLLSSHQVSLPPTMCFDIAQRLHVSSTLLPSSLRTFNRMNVGYLFA